MSGNNDLRIKIVAKLDETLSTKQLQDQLDKISSKLKLNIGIDTNQINQISNAIKNLQTQVGNKNNKGNPIIQFDDIEKGSVKVFKDVDSIRKEFGKIGELKFNKIFNPITKDLQQLQVEIKKADGLIEKLNFNSVRVQNGNSFTDQLQLTGLKQVEQKDRIREQQLQQIQKINQKIQQEEQNLADQIASGREKANQKRIQDEKKLAENQAKAVNESIEKRKQLEQSYEQWWLKSLKEREIKEISTEQKIQQNLQKEKDKAKKSLQDLARTGKFTTDELRKIGQSINLSTSIKQVEQLKTRMNNMRIGDSLKSDQERIRESLQRVYSQGLVNERFFKSFNTIINSSRNVAEIEKVEKALKRVENHSKNTNKVNDMKQQLGIDASRLLQTHSKTVNTQGVNSIIAELNQITARTPQAVRQIEQLRMQLRQYRAEASEAARTSMSFGTALSTAFQKFPIWIFTAGAIYTPLRMMKDAIQQIISLDSQLIVLERVSNGQISINEALKESIHLSEQLGVRIHDLNEAMVNFARQGFRGEDLNRMAEVAALMSNVSTMGLEESASALTAAIKGFSLESSQAIDVVDKLNEVD